MGGKPKTAVRRKPCVGLAGSLVVRVLAVSDECRMRTRRCFRRGRSGIASGTGSVPCVAPRVAQADGWAGAGEQGSGPVAARGLPARPSGPAVPGKLGGDRRRQLHHSIGQRVSVAPRNRASCHGRCNDLPEAASQRQAQEVRMFEPCCDRVRYPGGLTQPSRWNLQRGGRSRARTYRLRR